MKEVWDDGRVAAEITMVNEVAYFHDFSLVTITTGTFSTVAKFDAPRFHIFVL